MDHSQFSTSAVRFRPFQDRFGRAFAPSSDRLCFAPAIMDMVIFPSAQAHTETRSHDTIMYHQAHTPRSPTRLHPPARPLSRPRCAASQLTIKLKIEDTRILQHAGSLQVTSSCSCNGTHLTDAAESRPFLALRYESRPSLPLLDRCDEGCAAQG